MGNTEPKGLEQKARELLSWFGLKNGGTLVKDLSGGQKACLNFAFLSLHEHTMLLLDEPTNHLDATGVKKLIDALQKFPGGIVVVSHDKYLIRKILRCDNGRLLVCRDGQVKEQARHGMEGLKAYEREALHEQHARAEAAQQLRQQLIDMQRQNQSRKQQAREARK